MKLMKTTVKTSFVMILAAAALGTSMTFAAKKSKKAPEASLTAAGQKLENQYADQLKALKAELAKALPTVNARAKAAFLKSREDEVAAQVEIEAAQKGMNAIKAAQGGVGHAKGKWIGGADKGIAAAKAKLKNAKTAAERDAAKEELAKWEKNREEGVAALKERQAALDKAERERPAVEKKMKAAEKKLAEAKAVTLKAVKDLKLEALLSSDKLDVKLAKYVVMHEATPNGLAAFAEQGEAQQKLIDKMLSSDDLLVEMAVADGATNGKYGQAMQIYSDIWAASDKVAEGPLRRLALAIALEHAVPVKQRNAVADTAAPATVDPVKRYLHYEKALINDELDPAFKKSNHLGLPHGRRWRGTG